MSTAADIYVAIPAFNAGKTLEAVLTGVVAQVERKKIIVIDDGSNDDTNYCAKHFEVTVLKHKSNLGKGAAIKTAFSYVLQETAAQALITLDADGQHRPEDIPRFVSAFVQSSSDLVIGARNFSIGVMPFFRILSNTLTSQLLSWKLGQHIEDSQSGFRLYSRRLIANAKLKTNGYETESEILINACRTGIRVTFISIPAIYRNELSHIRGGREILRFVRLYLELY